VPPTAFRRKRQRYERSAGVGMDPHGYGIHEGVLSGADAGEILAALSRAEIILCRCTFDH